jgi:hypothetical protein
MNNISAVIFFIFALVFALFALWLTLPSTKGMIGEYFVKKQLEKTREEVPRIVLSQFDVW